MPFPLFRIRPLPWAVAAALAGAVAGYVRGPAGLGSLAHLYRCWMRIAVCWRA